MIEVLAAASKTPLDPVLKEMLPPEALALLEVAGDIKDRLVHVEAAFIAKREYVDEINQALVDYAQESGAGAMFLDNVRLCLEQVKIRKLQAGRN